MTVLYIVAILLQVGVIIYFVRRGRKQKEEKKESVSVPDDNTFEGLRNLALHVTPAQLKLAIPDNETLVYGVIMDCNIGEAIITLSAYINGAVSIYFSSGGVKTGGGMDPQVAEVAADFVITAQDYIGRAIQVNTTELPLKSCVRFFFLTNHGLFVAQEQLAYFENGSSTWLPLFEKGNEVINLLHSSGNGATAQ